MERTGRDRLRRRAASDAWVVSTAPHSPTFPSSKDSSSDPHRFKLKTALHLNAASVVLIIKQVDPTKLSDPLDFIFTLLNEKYRLDNTSSFIAHSMHDFVKDDRVVWTHKQPVLSQALFLIGMSASQTTFAQELPSDGSSLSSREVLPPAIHATRLDYSKFDAPESVTVITQEDIRRAGYLEVSEIFRSVPGFRIVKIGDESRLSYHGTAARQNRRMLVTIDGRSVLIGDGQYVEFDRLPIDLDDIARVTITRGPNGAAYGDNAFLASIDFQTVGGNKDPRGFAVRAGGGHNGRRKLSADVNKKIGRYDVELSMGTQRDGGYDYYDAAKTPRDDGKDIKRARLSVEREASEHSRWRLDSNFYDGENATGIRSLSFTGKQHNDGRFIALSNTRELDELSRLDWSVSYNRQSEAIRQSGCYTPESIARTSAIVTDPEDLAGLLAPTLFVPELLGVSLEDTCFFVDLGIESERDELAAEYESHRGDWRYLFGASATQVDAASAEYFSGVDQKQRSYRVFGESDVGVGPLHLSLGAMAQDSSNVTNTEFAWRGAVNWQISPDQMLRYSYTKSFRIPSLVETETLWTGAFLFGRRNDPLSNYSIRLPLPLVTRSTRLRAETIKANSIDYFRTFLGSSASVDIKAFHEKIFDPVEASLFYFSPPPTNGRAYSLSGSEVELVLRLSDRWKITGQASYLDTDAQSTVERGLYGEGAGSALLTYQPSMNHAFTMGYYGNSDISGNSYDRYDLVYNYTQSWIGHLVRLQVVLNHHVGGVDGIHDASVLQANEGYFAHLDQIFMSLELDF